MLREAEMGGEWGVKGSLLAGQISWVFWEAATEEGGGGGGQKERARV